MKRASVLLLLVLVLVVSWTAGAKVASARIISDGGGGSDKELPPITTDPPGIQIDPWQYKVDEHTYYIKRKR